MTFRKIIQLPRKNFFQSSFSIIICFLIIILATIYPSDMKNDYSVSRNGHEIPLVMAVENYGRYVNTILPIVITFVLRDWTGLKQLCIVAVSTVLSTHISKRALNKVKVSNTRLGERPFSPISKHNMPSGHSSEAALGAFFMMRRYSKWFGIIVLPILLLTMYARFMLDAHTASATIAGAALGALMVLLFSTKIPKSKKNSGDFL